MSDQRLKLLKEKWEKIAPRLLDEGECRIYHTKKGGIPSINLAGTVMGMQRAAYLLHNGHVDNRLCVVSLCGRKNCVNPDHLLEVTRSEMMKLRKVHERINIGADHPSTDLDDATVIAIRERVAAGEMPKEVAADLETTYQAVIALVKGRSWKHLAGPIWGKDYTVMGRGRTRRIVWRELER